MILLIIMLLIIIIMILMIIILNLNCKAPRQATEAPFNLHFFCFGIPTSNVHGVLVRTLCYLLFLIVVLLLLLSLSSSSSYPPPPLLFLLFIILFFIFFLAYSSFSSFFLLLPSLFLSHPLPLSHLLHHPTTCHCSTSSTPIVRHLLSFVSCVFEVPCGDC